MITDPWIRFLRKVEVRGDGCWAWTGTVAGTKGPPRPTFRPTTRSSDPKVYAFRWAYEHKFGPVDDGLEVDHTCNHPWCVNPDHGEPVTPGENMRRARLAVCRAGLHDLADPANVRWDAQGRRRGCKMCWLARARERYRRR